MELKEVRTVFDAEEYIRPLLPTGAKVMNIELRRTPKTLLAPHGFIIVALVRGGEADS